jgi:hypothetical protein
MLKKAFFVIEKDGNYESFFDENIIFKITCDIEKLENSEEEERTKNIKIIFESEKIRYDAVITFENKKLYEGFSGIIEIEDLLKLAILDNGTLEIWITNGNLNYLGILTGYNVIDTKKITWNG